MCIILEKNKIMEKYILNIDIIETNLNILLVDIGNLILRGFYDGGAHFWLQGTNASSGVVGQGQRTGSGGGGPGAGAGPSFPCSVCYFPHFPGTYPTHVFTL